MPQAIPKTNRGARVPAGPLVPLLLGAHWQDDEPGGLNRYHAQLFLALRAIGLSPLAVTSGPAVGAPGGLVTGGQFDQRLPRRLWGFARAATAAARTGATVVDAHFAFYAFGPLVLGRLRRLPLVVHFQGPWAEESQALGESAGWRIAVKRGVEGIVYRRAGAVIVLSDAFKQLLVARYGVSPSVIHVVPPGIDLSSFAPGNRLAARAQLGLDPDGAVVVVVRRMVPRMGLDVLIDAWSQVQAALPTARLLVVGDGPDRRRLERLAADAAATSVRFLGRVDESTIVHCYQAADLSVVPSLSLEGFGLVVLESLACGTPTIVTDAGGLPEAVLQLDPSLIVPAGDPDAMSRRILAALIGENPLPDQGRCRDHAQLFAWPAVAERHREIYAQVRGPKVSRLRVAYIDHCAQLSGGELSLLRLLPALQEIDAHVILGEDGPLVARLRAVGVSVEVLEIGESARSLGREQVRPGRLSGSIVAAYAAYTARLAKHLRRLKPDLVHTNSLKADLYGGAAARLAAIPVVWHVHDRISEDYLPAPACRLIRTVASLVPAEVIANSQTTLATLRLQKAGVVIPCALGFMPSLRPEAPRPHLRIGIVGRLDEWKGQDVFLDAFAKAFPAGQEQAVIVGAALFGDGGYRHQLDVQTAALGLQSRVEFRGFRDDIEGELRRLDVLVHASTIPEPFGQVVIEGMAAGLPVVAADAGGPSELIEHGVDGLLYPMGDRDALAQVLRELAADRALRGRLGAAACGRAAEFTPDRIAPQVTAAYRRILSRRPAYRARP